ncbi:MAG: sugar ABC transporter ATP-binding protein [Anaerococcus vaginalis]|uniref:sugar ABC transporter ATP-binding protein n=1 Tax=Anaerococcus vaginalis TaxID=33037 RepID=UPI00290744E4|nr:sugar ABC transporter ATP-binding protein [Anaerococcus vaginalis]MDU7650240.1 sugar ABC transporter ATP-binding protein [Anaerococcus vaginalis]
MQFVMQNINKSFGNNKVLNSCNLEIESSEVLGLMGENGAGKSTLMNILAGVHTPDGGQILIDGKEIDMTNPNISKNHGINFIHQELNNWPELTVLENLFMNAEPVTKLGTLDIQFMKSKIKSVMDQYGIFLELDKKVKDLSIGDQQMLEILKSLINESKLIIMDEPTAALSNNEISKLFNIIKTLKIKGVAVIYISHRMDEIFQICDSVLIMRDGVTLTKSTIDNITMDEIIRLMVGRSINEFYPEREVEIGDTIFNVENLSSENNSFSDIRFSLKSGEVLGFSGLMGAGRTEVMRAIFGIDSLKSGDIYINGEQIKEIKPSVMIKKGVGFITDDRKDEGLILDYDIKNNISLPIIDLIKSKIPFIISDKKEDSIANDYSKKLRIKCSSIYEKVGNLSGGNQQKVVLSKWLPLDLKVLILDEPTRGIDVGSKREIYDLINDLAKKGVSIILVSSDLPEVMGMSDRIIVFHEGKIESEFSRKDFDQEKIMLAAVGGKK